MIYEAGFDVHGCSFIKIKDIRLPVLTLIRHFNRCFSLLMEGRKAACVNNKESSRDPQPPNKSFSSSLLMSLTTSSSDPAWLHRCSGALPLRLLMAARPPRVRPGGNEVKLPAELRYITGWSPVNPAHV